MFEGNSLLALVSRLRGAFYHRGDPSLTISGQRVAYAAKTADYTMTPADYLVSVACSSANITITLPTAASSTGQIYTIVKTDATEYAVVVDPPGAETLNGVSSFGMTGQYAAASFFSTGSVWLFAPRQRDDIYQAKTANYTLTSFDGTVNCTANSFTITLPTAVGAIGRVYNIKNSGTGTITLNTTSSQTIDGNASGALTLAQWDNLTLQSDGANWIIL